MRLSYTREKPPCFDCNERKLPTAEDPVGCHDPEICDKWARYKSGADDDNAAVRKAKAENMAYDDYVAKQQAKAMRMKGRK